MIFRSLRHPNFRLFFAGQGVSLLGTWMQNIAQSWLVYDITKTSGNASLWLGLIGFIGSVPVLLFSLLGGAIADRVNKRPLILGTQTIAMLLALILGLLTAFGMVHLWHVATLAFLLGLTAAFDMPARQSFIIEMVGKEDIGNAIALNAALFNSARLIGPAVAGALIVSVGTATCFFVNSASFLAVIVGLLLMKFPPFTPQSTKSSVLQSTLEGLRYVRRTPHVLALIALVAIVTIFGWSYSVLMPIFADKILGRGAKGLGMLMSCNGIGALAAALTLAAVTDKVRPRRMAFTGIGVFSVAVTVLGLSKTFWLSGVAMMFVGFGLVTFFATSNGALQRRVPDEIRGRVMGIYSFSFMGLFPIGSLLTGLLAHRITAPYTVIFGACVCALAAIVVAKLVPPAPEPASAPLPAPVITHPTA